MAFPYVMLANFRASQSQAMTPFLRGQIWLTCVGPGGFLGDLLYKKTPKNTKGHFAGPICSSQSGDI
jgi:hypothetical protein